MCKVLFVTKHALVGKKLAKYIRTSSFRAGWASIVFRLLLLMLSSRAWSLATCEIQGSNYSNLGIWDFNFWEGLPNSLKYRVFSS